MMSKWEVTTDPLQLRRLGKLGEELGECSAVASRCIIQGINETDPSTRTPNRLRLESELADVMAQIACTIAALGLNNDYIQKRAAQKVEQMQEWESYFRSDETKQSPD